MKVLYFIICLFSTVIISCKSKEKEASDKVKTQTKLETKNESNNLDNQTIPFSFSDFKIGDNKLGPIEKGMKISDAEKKIKGLVKKEGEAVDYGVDGGGVAYVFYLNNEAVFSLIPGYNSDTIIYIVALSENLKTENELNPKSTVNDLIKEYQNITLYRDIIFDWETFYDKKNHVTFYFKTYDEKTQIGNYPEFDSSKSKPKKNLSTKSDFILI